MSISKAFWYHCLFTKSGFSKFSVQFIPYDDNTYLCYYHISGTANQITVLIQALVRTDESNLLTMVTDGKLMRF